MADVQLSVVVPAFNEEKRISKTLQTISRFLDLQSWSAEIIVVDDGSRDRTRAVVEALGLPNLHIVDYGQNRGKGYAINYGVKQARGQWILFTDADNSTPISELPKLWVWKDQFPVIIGSRYLPGSQIPVKQPAPRIVLSRLGNLLIRALLLRGIKDTQCGFKLFSRPAAQAIFSRQTIYGWGFDMELLRIARDLDYPIKEVAITWFNNNESRIHSSRVFTKTLAELWQIRKNSLAGRYLKKRPSA